MRAAPGWYPDPTSPDTDRWFDGTGWAAHTRTRVPPASAGLRPTSWPPAGPAGLAPGQHHFASTTSPEGRPARRQGRGLRVTVGVAAAAAFAAAVFVVVRRDPTPARTAAGGSATSSTERGSVPASAGTTVTDPELTAPPATAPTPGSNRPSGPGADAIDAACAGSSARLADALATLQSAAAAMTALDGLDPVTVDVEQVRGPLLGIVDGGLALLDVTRTVLDQLPGYDPSLTDAVAALDANSAHLANALTEFRPLVVTATSLVDLTGPLTELQATPVTDIATKFAEYPQVAATLERFPACASVLDATVGADRHH